MKLRILIFLFFNHFFMGCFGDSINQNEHNLRSKEVLKISVESFFENSQIADSFKVAQEHPLGFLVPQSLLVNEDTVIILDRYNKVLRFYYENKFLRALRLQSDNMEWMPDVVKANDIGQYYLLDWRKNAVYKEEKRGFKKMFECSSMSFSVYGQNISCIRNGYQIVSNQRKLDNISVQKGDYEWDLAFVDSSSIAFLARKVPDVLTYIEYNNGKISHIQKFIIPPKIKSVWGVKILDANLDYVLAVIQGHAKKSDYLIYLDLRSEELVSWRIKQNITEEKLIGEGAVVWPSKLIYSYSKEGKLYYMYSTRKNIKVFEVVLPSIK
jgi:hypothetical protein